MEPTVSKTCFSVPLFPTRRDYRLLKVDSLEPDQVVTQSTGVSFLMGNPTGNGIEAMHGNIPKPPLTFLQKSSSSAALVQTLESKASVPCLSLATTPHELRNISKAVENVPCHSWIKPEKSILQQHHVIPSSRSRALNPKDDNHNIIDSHEHRRQPMLVFEEKNLKENSENIGFPLKNTGGECPKLDKKRKQDASPLITTRPQFSPYQPSLGAVSSGSLDKVADSRNSDWGKFLALSSNNSEVSNPKKEDLPPQQSRFDRLQSLLKKLDEPDIELDRMLWSLPPAARSWRAVELEAKAICLALEEAKELKRMRVLGVLTKSSPKGDGVLQNEWFQEDVKAC
ncbi:hypothetical protein AMTRI_Chr08g208170 [Amborella trichopoda]